MSELRAISVPVVLRLVGTFLRNADVIGLFVSQLSDPRADSAKMQPRDLFVKMLRQNIDFVAVIIAVLPKLDLCEHLIGEGVGHHETRVAGSTAKVYESTFGQQDNALTIWENYVVDLWLDVFPLVLVQVSDINLAVEMPDIADDCLVLHALHL